MIKFIKRTAYLTVLTGSSLTYLNHNSTHVSSIYLIPHNYTPHNNFLTSDFILIDILLFNHEF